MNNFDNIKKSTNELGTIAMTEELKSKIAVLEERIANVKEGHSSLKKDMDERFNTVDGKFEKLSAELKTMGKDMQEGFNEIKEVISESKGFAHGGWKVATVVGAVVLALGSVIGFAVKYLPHP